MKGDPTRFMFGSVAAGVLAAVLAASCGGQTSVSGPSAISVATITITSSGVDPQLLRISSGQMVRFVNTDSVNHAPSSNPHPSHTDCPAINQTGELQPGAGGTTGVLSVVRSCGYHDHLRDSDRRFWGQIVIGDAAPVDPVPGEGY